MILYSSDLNIQLSGNTAGTDHDTLHRVERRCQVSRQQATTPCAKRTARRGVGGDSVKECAGHVRHPFDKHSTGMRCDMMSPDRK